MNYNKNIINSKDYISIYLMSDDGIEISCLSYFEKEKYKMWLSNLNISEGHRGKGRGNDMLKYAIDTANNIGCKYLYLSVEKGTFMYSWYIKYGFIPYNEDENYIYMFLEIKK